MFHPSLIFLSIASASAAPAASPPELKTPPVYLAIRGAVAVPNSANGAVSTGGVALGVVLDSMNSLGLRVIYMDSPPDNPLASYTPEIPWAWGPVLDWQHNFLPDSGFSFYSNISLGYVYGVPNDKTANNVILPILEGGVGIRMSRQTPNGGLLYVSPELGFVPGAVAPYTALSVGMIMPGDR
jgi:hypothetical protein